MKLCCLETVWQYISDFEIHGREIDKFDFVNNSLSQIIGDGNKPLFCQNINLKQDPFKVSLEKNFWLGVLWFSCRLLFPNTSAGPGLVLGSTARSEWIVDLELTIVDRGLSDLLISLLCTSNMRCEAPTAGCAEVLLSSVVYAMTGLDNCPLSCCQSLCSIKWIGAFLGMKIF